MSGFSRTVIIQGAPSPSGKAEVCKTSIPGSNPGGASKILSGREMAVFVSGTRSGAFPLEIIAYRGSCRSGCVRPERTLNTLQSLALAAAAQVRVVVMADHVRAANPGKNLRAGPLMT